MINLTLKLPKNLENHLNYLETVSKQSKEFIIKEALIQYLEDAEDKIKLLERERSPQKDSKTYTTEELLENLNLKD
jgi:predicted DNA-binding protein